MGERRKWYPNASIRAHLKRQSLLWLLIEALGYGL